MFNNIIGHDDKKAYFKKVIQKHNISHSYIFYGEDGIGKATFAKELAKVIMNTQNLAGCPDYKYISKLDDKKDILIEQIRKELIQDIYIAPISSDYKVYVIDDAECLNVASQNALLKTLEEPPRYTVIILICSNINNILPTIVSRANKIDFLGVDKYSVKKYINDKFNISLSQNILEFINGSIGKAIDIIQDNLIGEFDKIDKLIDCIVKKDIIKSLRLSQDINFNDNSLIQYFEFSLYTLKKYEAIKFIEKSILRLKSNGNYDIVIDNMILRMIDEV